ncbi:MAG: flavin reductase family protein [Firmicutes bacterium]|nr:flavin reductase family protein [Bacillota bacterium]
MAKRSLKPGTLLCPVPAVMVTCGSGDEKNIITIGWTGIINSEPPMTYVSVRKSRHSHHLIEESGEFVINVTTEALAFATDYCGVKSGRDVDKFKEMKLTPVPCEKVSCPMIEESPVNLECKVTEVHSYPTHDMFVAEIVAMHVDESIFDEKGRMPVEELGLLAYAHGHYLGVKRKPIGRFGYSIMKPKTKKRINREQHQERVEKNRAKRETSAERTTRNPRAKRETSAARTAGRKKAIQDRPVKSVRKK